MRLALAATALLACCAAPAFADAGGKKVLYLNAYHHGYPWSDGIERALVNKLDQAGVQVKVFRMDTKQNPAGAADKAAQVKAMLDQEKPDLVVVSDDNPVKLVVTPFLKNAATPVVFCGVNWDGAAHGLPYTNTTGMYEVAVIEPMVELLRHHAKGARVGLLASDNESSRADGAGIKKYGGQAKLTEVYAKDLDGWKAGFLELQGKVDILLLRNDGIKGWSDAQMATWIEENVKIPTGAMQEEVEPFALATFAKVPAEQGEWAADAALKILGGAKPSSIPPARNRRAHVLLNANMARVLHIEFSPEEAKGAKIK